MKLLSAITLTTMLSSSSCVHVFTKSNTYDTSVSTVVNGATISTSIKPKEVKPGPTLSAMVYMAASAKQKGPFAWRIEAEGVKGQHATMVVHRLKVETEKTNRKNWFDSNKLGKTTKFIRYEKEPNKCFAIFKVPGELRVSSETDGNITVYADITITTNQKSVRKGVKFNLAAELNKREAEFISIPAEVINSFGEKDPREWDL